MPESDRQPDFPAEADVDRQLRRLSRRSFTVGGVAALLGLGGWYWLRTRALEDGIPWPFRRVLALNERLARAYFKPTRLAPTFPADRAAEPRINGLLGLERALDGARWKLRIETPARRAPALELTLDAIRALPRVGMVTELKCIEGWSVPVQWAGARLLDLAAHYRLGTHSGDAPDPERRPDDLLPYAGLETPDGGYYVGLDAASAFHPQTLLCYEMNGKPLTPEHGAPLRLVIPVKYGIKSIKRIGTLRFSAQRPRDYWAERGYDWYAGH